MGGPNYHSSLSDGTFDGRGKSQAKSPSSSSARANGQSASSSQSDGQRLASITRKDGAEELRVESKSFNSYPYFDIRVWFKTDAGEWRPTKTGVTIKPRELDEVIAALTKAKGR